MSRRIFRTAEAAIDALNNLPENDSDDDQDLYLNHNDDRIFEDEDIVVEEEVEFEDPIDQIIDEVIRKAMEVDDRKLIAKCGMEWFKLQEDEHSSVRNKVNFRHYNGVTNYAINRIVRRSALDAFSLIFSVQMMNMVVQFTRDEAARYDPNFKFETLITPE
jgi:hypothetical protein